MFYDELVTETDTNRRAQISGPQLWSNMPSPKPLGQPAAPSSPVHGRQLFAPPIPQTAPSRPAVSPVTVSSARPAQSLGLGKTLFGGALLESRSYQTPGIPHGLDLENLSRNDILRQMADNDIFILGGGENGYLEIGRSHDFDTFPP